MAPKKKPKQATTAKVSVAFADDSGPAARPTTTPDADAALAHLRGLAQQPRDEKGAAVAAAKAKLGPAVKAAEAAVEQLEALVKQHAALVAAAERDVDPAVLLAYGLPSHEVSWFTSRIEQAQRLQSNTASTMHRLRDDIRQLDHEALNGNRVNTIARDLRALTFIPAGYAEHVKYIEAMVTNFAGRLQRRGAGTAVVERLIDIKHPEPRFFEGPRVEID